jgi:preprotein translocase subunit YajC
LTLTVFAYFTWHPAGPLVLAADPGVGGGLLQFLILFGPLFLIWYVLVILPQQRQRKKTQEMLSNLKTGDRVLTSGGIYGTIVGFRDTVVQLQVSKEVKLDVARSAITGLQGAEKEKESGSMSPKEGAKARK